MNPDLFRIPGPWGGWLAAAKRPRGGDWLDDAAEGWRVAGLKSEQLKPGRERVAAQ